MICVATERAEVLFEYEPENSDELRLSVGTIIEDVVKAEDGWMEGTLNGSRGVFPDNFVKVLEDSAPPPAATSTDGGIVLTCMSPSGFRLFVPT